MNNRVISTLLIFLTTILFLSLCLSFLAVLGVISWFSFIDEKNLNLLPGISIGCGGMIAILAYIRDRSHQGKDRTRKSDELYLGIARESFNEVYDLLKDCNNDRVIWVRSSRLLLQALELKTKIETSDIVEAFEVSEERLRTELYRTLSIVLDDSENRQPLPPQFFYGIEDWETEKNMDAAALKSGSKIVCASVNINENIPSPSSGGLSKQSVIAIYDFMEFPKDYDDPLKKVNDWDDSWADSYGIVQGAKRYVAHTNENTVIGDKLHKKESKLEKL